MSAMTLLSIRHVCEAKPVAVSESQYRLSDPVRRTCSRCADSLRTCWGSPNTSAGPCTDPTPTPHWAPRVCTSPGGNAALCFLLHPVHGTVYSAGVNNHSVLSVWWPALVYTWHACFYCICLEFCSLQRVKIKRRSVSEKSHLITCFYFYIWY